MAKNFVLIATVGQRDIQAVLPGKDGKERAYEISPKCQRALHEAFRDGKVRWHMRDLTEPIPGQLHIRLSYNEQTCYLVPERDELAEEEDSSFPKFDHVDLGQDEVQLCAPLMAKVVRQIRQAVEAGNLGKCLRVCLLNSDRPDDEQFGRREPFFAPALLTEAVAKALNIGPENVTVCNYVESGDVLEADALGQVHLRSDIAERIDHQIAELRRGCPQALALVADAGGIPSISPVLVEICLGHFGPSRLRVYRPTEREPRRGAREGRIIPPQEWLAVRRRVCELIETGAFQAAVRLLESGLEGVARASRDRFERWARPLRAAVEVIYENRQDQRGLQQDLGGETTVFHALKACIDLAPALPAAIRVENALRQGQTVWALRELFTFRDVLRWQLIETYLSRSRQKGCIDWSENKFLPERANNRLDDVREKFREHFQSIQTIALAEEGNALWEVLRKALPGDVWAEWEPFEKALDEIRRIRNQATHRYVARGDRKKALSRLERGDVWINSDGRFSFLASPVAQGLFKVMHPRQQWSGADLYENILKALRREILGTL